MSQELVYTSAPKGLKPGSKGFCTVAMTAGMTGATVERLESLSGYRALYPLGDARSTHNPINWCHWRVNINGQPRSVVSRVAFAGADYSQRSNKLAHHVVLEPSEQSPAGPANLLLIGNIARTTWSGEPEQLPTGPSISIAESPPAICKTWARLTGDAGWAAALADAYLENPSRPVYLIYPPEAASDVLQLFEESMSLLPNRQRWDVTFSTYFIDLPLGLTCSWRGKVEDTNISRGSILKTAGQTVVDISKITGSQSNDSALAVMARTGQLEHAPNFSSSLNVELSGAATVARSEKIPDRDFQTTRRLKRNPSPSYVIEEPSTSIGTDPFDFEEEGSRNGVRSRTLVILLCVLFAALITAAAAIWEHSHQSHELPASAFTSAPANATINQTSQPPVHRVLVTQPSGPTTNASADHAGLNRRDIALGIVATQAASMPSGHTTDASADHPGLNRHNIAVGTVATQPTSIPSSQGKRLVEILPRNVPDSEVVKASALTNCLRLDPDAVAVDVATLNDVSRKSAVTFHVTQHLTDGAADQSEWIADDLTHAPDILGSIDNLSMIWPDGSTTLPISSAVTTRQTIGLARLLTLKVHGNVLMIQSHLAPPSGGLPRINASQPNDVPVACIGLKTNSLKFTYLSGTELLPKQAINEISRSTIVGMVGQRPFCRLVMHSLLPAALVRKRDAKVFGFLPNDECVLRLVNNDSGWKPSYLRDGGVKCVAPSVDHASIYVQLKLDGADLHASWDFDDPAISVGCDNLPGLLADRELIDGTDGIRRLAKTDANELMQYKMVDASTVLKRAKQDANDFLRLDKEINDRRDHHRPEEAIAPLESSLNTVSGAFSSERSTFDNLVAAKAAELKKCKIAQTIVEVQLKNNAFPIEDFVIQNDFSVK